MSNLTSDPPLHPPLYTIFHCCWIEISLWGNSKLHKLQKHKIEAARRLLQTKRMTQREEVIVDASRHPYTNEERDVQEKLCADEEIQHLVPSTHTSSAEK